LQQLAEGIFLVAGRTHNALVVDMSDHLVVIDAPIDDAYGAWILKACHERFPLKPIKALVLTHHHNDHSGGARAFVAAGADILVGAGNRAHFERMFAAPHLLDRDTLQLAPKPAHVLEVVEPQTLKAGKGGLRLLQLVPIANHHAKGMLVAYLPNERIAFVADLWSPERDKLRAPITFERHKDLVDALRAAKITPRLIVGGHGSVGNYAELATAVDAGPSEP
jgi:glyoxylase-like metal-dependent hydrolase (beta-lactamase superfamily II)